jgi:hypothetical protein
MASSLFSRFLIYARKPEMQRLNVALATSGCISGRCRYIATDGDLKETALYTIGGVLLVPSIPIIIAGTITNCAIRTLSKHEQKWNDEHKEHKIYDYDRYDEDGYDYEYD